MLSDVSPPRWSPEQINEEFDFGIVRSTSPIDRYIGSSKTTAPGMSDSERQHLFRVFEELDKDGDTTLSALELQTGMENQEVKEILQKYGMGGFNAASLLHHLDANHDNGVSVLEFIKGMVDLAGEGSFHSTWNG